MVAPLPRQPGPRWQARPFDSRREARRCFALPFRARSCSTDCDRVALEVLESIETVLAEGNGSRLPRSLRSLASPGRAGRRDLSTPDAKHAGASLFPSALGVAARIATGLRWKFWNRLRLFWRKGTGVEPARRRLAPPTGFEARPTHRGRVPSCACTLVGRFTSPLHPTVSTLSRWHGRMAFKPSPPPARTAGCRCAAGGRHRAGATGRSGRSIRGSGSPACDRAPSRRENVPR